MTRGSVEVAESGQLLALLETGATFGDSVAFGRCDQQPFSDTRLGFRMSFLSGKGVQFFQ